MSLKQERQNATPVLDRVNDAIRDNPLAAGLIGAGLAWMLFGTKGFGVLGGLAKDVGGKVASAAKSVGSAAVETGSAALNAGATASSAVKGAATEVVKQVASIVPDLSHADIDGATMDGATTDGATKAVKDAGSAVNDRLQSAVSTGREYGAVIQSRFSESLDQQPLLLGVVGLAIGAGLASTFAATQVEREWMGATSDAARDSLEGAVDEVKTRARQVVSDVQDEAAKQGLTMDAATDAAKAVAGKVGNVAGAARDTVIQPFKSPS